MKQWVVQYIYATEKEKNGLSISVIEADTLEDAKKRAAENAVAEEFIFTVHPQTEEQFLGQVDHQVRMKVGQGMNEEIDPDMD